LLKNIKKSEDRDFVFTLKYIYFNELQILGYPGVVAKKTADDLRPTEADKSDDKSDKNDTEAK
ncbi:hypothetical protein DIX88_08175, partial [Streptococcus iniae]